MTEMVERVARYLDPTAFAFGYQAAERRPAVLEQARELIQLMREPTDAMVLAGAQYHDDNWRPTHAREDTNAEAIWQDMLDAALAEPPPLSDPLKE